MIAAALLGAATQFVAMRANVNAYGIRGTATIVLDRYSGRFARRFSAGAASEQEGFDGTNAWRADATGMSRIQTNSGERREILEWSQALRDAVNSSVSVSHAYGATDQVTIRFENFRKSGNASIPQRIISHSAQNGDWSAEVVGVNTATNYSPAAFSAPVRPVSDFQLLHVTRIPISMDIGSPTLNVRVNGTRLRFLFDTGGQNVITAEAAKQIGLNVSGSGVVSGGGGGTSAFSYASVRSLQIGDATLTNQPFIVLPADALPSVDGIVGYELLARLAARLDMTHGTLELAPSASAFGKVTAPIHFGYFDRQPQVDGSLDGIRGAFSIDTGSSLNAQVQTPVVRSAHLIQKLHATVAAYASDVGGKYPIYLVRAKTMRLGNALFPEPIVDLLTRQNASSNATIVANVGDGLLRRWIMVFDYPHQMLELRPGGDPNGSVIHDRSGIILTAKDNEVLIAQVLQGTPGADAGLVEGARITAINGNHVTAADLAQIRNLLRGASGTVVAIQCADGVTRKLVLRKFL